MKKPAIRCSPSIQLPGGIDTLSLVIPGGCWAMMRPP
jgi:hypothetical protein